MVGYSSFCTSSRSEKITRISYIHCTSSLSPPPHHLVSPFLFPPLSPPPPFLTPTITHEHKPSPPSPVPIRSRPPDVFPAQHGCGLANESHTACPDSAYCCGLGVINRCVRGTCASALWIGTCLPTAESVGGSVQVVKLVHG